MDGDYRQQQDTQCPRAPLVSARKLILCPGSETFLSSMNARLPRLVADGKTIYQEITDSTAETFSTFLFAMKVSLYSATVKLT